MIFNTKKSEDSRNLRWLAKVLLFWCGYVATTLLVGFVTSSAIKTEVWQLTAWGAISSLGLLGLTAIFVRFDSPSERITGPKSEASSACNFTLGLLLGALSFGVHTFIVSSFAGPIRFELVPEIGATIVIIYFLRFLATAWMEEIGFRGYALQKLADRWGSWPAVVATSLIFGLSHLLYGWNIQTIMLGVFPAGLLWGMSAIATKGIAMPIGLHAAWNFATWSAGSRPETGLLRLTIEHEAQGLMRTVGTVSYLTIFLSMTLVFWWFHRRSILLASQRKTDRLQ